MTFTPKMVTSLDRYPPTRRDYEMMASIISGLPAGPTRKRVAIHFIDWLSRYAGFDGERFLKACHA